MSGERKTMLTEHQEGDPAIRVFVSLGHGLQPLTFPDPHHNMPGYDLPQPQFFFHCLA